jgi:hypothetical protein
LISFKRKLKAFFFIKYWKSSPSRNFKYCWVLYNKLLIWWSCTLVCQN